MKLSKSRVASFHPPCASKESGGLQPDGKRFPAKHLKQLERVEGFWSLRTREARLNSLRFQGHNMDTWMCIQLRKWFDHLIQLVCPCVCVSHFFTCYQLPTSVDGMYIQETVGLIQQHLHLVGFFIWLHMATAWPSEHYFPLELTSKPWVWIT